MIIVTVGFEVVYYLSQCKALKHQLTKLPDFYLRLSQCTLIEGYQLL